jgi:3-oxoacyl-[acyl-carrier protein] reductase
VAVCARGRDELEAAAAEIETQTGARVLPVVCDMANGGDIQRLVQQTAETFGRIDIVVNNAGGPPLGAFDDLGDAEWQKAIDQNLLSAVRTIREALPLLRRQGGRIINITSVAVKQPIDRLMLSNSARLGVVGMAKTLSREVAQDGITVNNICPGNIATQRLLSLFEARAQREGRTFQEVVEEEENRTPIGFLGEPSDVAALVTFLASEKARYISGATIQVDGGSTVAVF